MSETEDRLERAMRAHASTVNPTPDWDDVEQRAEQLQRRSLRRRAGFTLLGLAAAFVLVLGLVSVAGDDDSTKLAITPPDTTTTTEGTTTTSAPPTTTTPTTTPVPVRPETAIFPFEGERQFQDGGAAALAFAREYLGMPDPVVSLLEGDGEGGRYDVRPKPGSPIVTEVDVVRADTAHYVTGARTRNIDLVSPEPGDRISSPVTVSGSSTAFEAQVNWEVREDGQVFGQKLGEGFFMGGSNGEFGPFEAPLAFTGPTKPAGAIVLLTYSAEDGSVSEATVIRVTFG